MRTAADWLDQRPQFGRDAFRRGRPEVSGASRGGDLTDLLRACLPALLVSEDTAVALQPRPPPLWTASDALAWVGRLLDVLPTAARSPPSCQTSPRTRRRARCGTVRPWPAP
jgi:hypothetical protein